jgi:hypothetical protein
VSPFAARHAAVVTPSDTTDLTVVSDYISFANSGAQTLQVTMLGGEIVSGIVLPSGMYHLMVRRVWASGTTVTNIVEYWS